MNEQRGRGSAQGGWVMKILLCHILTRVLFTRSQFLDVECHDALST